MPFHSLTGRRWEDCGMILRIAADQRVASIFIRARCPRPQPALRQRARSRDAVAGRRHRWPEAYRLVACAKATRARREPAISFGKVSKSAPDGPIVDENLRECVSRQRLNGHLGHRGRRADRRLDPNTTLLMVAGTLVLRWRAPAGRIEKSGRGSAW